jgi:cytochrome c553
MSIKRNFVIFQVIAISIFTACTDKENKEDTSKITISNTTKIEVIQNANMLEVKVKEKEKTKLQVKDGKAYYYDYNIKSEYDENSQPANKDASIRLKPRTVLDANMHIRSPYERVQVSLIVKQLSKNFKVKCSACHDDYANGVIGPSLLGKNSSFIYNKIIEFKTNKVSNPLMYALIKQMSNEEIKIIANEIYNFNKKIEEMRRDNIKNMVENNDTI